MKVVSIIVAAGSGERLPGDELKQLTPIAGRPMLAWSAARLREVSEAVVMVAPAGREDELRAAVDPGVHAVVAGGATRQDSVGCGLAALPDDATHVLVHDAARPCVSHALLRRIVDALGSADAVVPAVPAVDTLIRESDSRVDAIVDRARIAGVQTPQAFELALLRRAHAAARRRGFQSSDDGSLVLALGEPVTTVAGERTNIKVTYPEDVAIAGAILENGAA